MKGAGAQSLLLAVAVLTALSLFRAVPALSSLPCHGQAPSSETKPQPYLGCNSVQRSSNRDVYFRIKPPCFSRKEQTLPWASQNTAVPTGGFPAAEFPREQSCLYSPASSTQTLAKLLFSVFPIERKILAEHRGLFGIHYFIYIAESAPFS